MSIVARRIYRKALWTAVGMIVLSASAVWAQVPDTWTLTGEMLSRAFFHTATLLPNAKVLVVGSGDRHVPFAQLFDPNAVDPATGRRGVFTRVADPTPSRSQATCSEGQAVVVRTRPSSCQTERCSLPVVEVAAIGRRSCTIRSQIRSRSLGT
jgi:hypothetical protein